VTAVVDETPRDRTLVLSVPGPNRDAFRFVPGQFVVLKDPAWDARLQRPYSLSSAPFQDGVLEVTIRDSGRMGDHLYGARTGQRLQVLPPRGHFVLEVRPGQDLVLLGGGSGVAPFRSFVRHLAAAGHGEPVAVLSSARVPEDLVFHGELSRLAAENPWLRYLPTVSRPPPDSDWAGRRGRIDAALLGEVVRDPARTLLYACGPDEFVDEMERLAAERGVPRERVRRERWG
jgi:ferredoxin-NADP reductase